MSYICQSWWFIPFLQHQMTDYNFFIDFVICSVSHPLTWRRSWGSKTYAAHNLESTNPASCLQWVFIELFFESSGLKLWFVHKYVMMTCFVLCLWADVSSRWQISSYRTTRLNTGSLYLLKLLVTESFPPFDHQRTSQLEYISVVCLSSCQELNIRTDIYVLELSNCNRKCYYFFCE